MKNMKINLEKFIGKRGIALVLASTMLVGLTGCKEKVECEVEGDHAHLYTSEEGYNAFYNKEYLMYDGYLRHDEYISLTEEETKLNKFLDKKDLIRLDDNLDVILSEIEDNHDYVEYRYSYKEKVSRIYGRVIVRKTVTRYSWTNDANHSDLTGETRVCHYVYQGCNVYKDEYDDYVVIPSEDVDDIRELVGKYEYVRKVYSKVVNLETGLDIDYDDGPEVSMNLNENDQIIISSSEYENGPKLVKF